MHNSGVLGSAEQPNSADAALNRVHPPTQPNRDKWACLPGRKRRVPDTETPWKESRPAGLYLLCTVEACAGFALYTVGALLVLLLTERARQSQGAALLRVGAFQAACCVAPFFGALLADRWLGLSVQCGRVSRC